MASVIMNKAIETRQKLGMSRKAFARDVLNVPYSTVEKWERGTVRMDASVRSLYRAVEFINENGLLEEFIKYKCD